MAVVAVVLLVIMWFVLDQQLRRIDARSSRVEALLLRLAEAQGIPDGGWDLDRVRAILAADETDAGTIEAVREYRRITGAPLLDSKQAVDRLRGER